MKYLLLLLILTACSTEKQPPIAGKWVSVSGLSCKEPIEKAQKAAQTNNTIEFSKKEISMTTYKGNCHITTVMQPEYFDPQNIVVWRQARVVQDTCNEEPVKVSKGEQRFKYELKDNVMKFTAQYGNAGCGYLVKI